MTRKTEKQRLIEQLIQDNWPYPEFLEKRTTVQLKTIINNIETLGTVQRHAQAG